MKVDKLIMPWLHSELMKKDFVEKFFPLIAINVNTCLGSKLHNRVQSIIRHAIVDSIVASGVVTKLMFSD